MQEEEDKKETVRFDPDSSHGLSGSVCVSSLDVCRILILREQTRNAADAISLAVAQEMIFFEYRALDIIAEKIADRHRCRLESLNIDVIQYL